MRFNLSEITALIKDRRTIYPEQYSERKIHNEQIELLLNNAIWAPTHGMVQPWRFVVLQEDARHSLAECLGSDYVTTIPKEQQQDAKLAKMMSRPGKASAIIALILDRTDSKVSEQDDFAAVACAVQNMHLVATAAGIGAFWATPGVMNGPKTRAYLDLNDQQRVVGLFYLGYPAIEWPSGQRKPIEYLTTWKKQ